MDGVSADLGSIITSTLALKSGERGAAVEMALLKNALDMQKELGAQIARMLQVGTVIDVSA